jgi:hypothetical protein
MTDIEEPYVVIASGDIIRTYDVSEPEEPKRISEIDGHWHEVTDLRLWNRKFSGDDGKVRMELVVLSVSLDGTIRRWKLIGININIPLSFITDFP